MKELAGNVENRQMFPCGSFGGSISIYSTEVHFCFQFELVCEGAGRLAGDAMDTCTTYAGPDHDLTDTLLGKMAADMVVFS